jgi:hypothetical protein
MTARQESKLWRVALGMALVSLFMAFFVTYRQYSLVSCLAERDAAARIRTAAIAEATDAERIADLRLLRDGTPESRDASISARVNTDLVRAAHPAPDVQPCG